jgi:CHAT domain-containing protein
MQQAAPPTRQGKYEVAERFARQAVALGRASHQKFVLVNSLGMVATAEMNRRQFEQALNDFTEALNLAHSAGAKSTAQKITGNVGWCYMQLGDIEEANRLYLEAFKDSEPRVRPTWLTNIANVLISERKYDAALAYAEQSLAAANTYGDESKIAASLENLAQVNIELQRYDVAAKLNAESLRLRHKNHESKEMLIPALLNDARIGAETGAVNQALATLDSIIGAAGDDDPLLWTAQATAASIYRRKLDDVASAERMYEAALETGDRARAHVTEEAYGFAFESNLIRLYDDYIDLLISEHRDDAALRVAERSRARTLRQGLGFPSRESIDPVALARKKNATILSYWLAPGRSLLWVITPRGLSMVTLQPADQIEREIDAYRRQIIDPVASSPIERGEHLYDMLRIRAIPADAPKRVIVLPDGKINAINLETLVVPTPQPHFWIEDVTMSYAPSLDLIDVPAPPRSGRNGRLLVMGSVPAAGPEFPALSQAGTEMNDVSSFFDRPRPVLIAGPAATAGAYLSSEPRQFDYIHFVAHGTANVRAPLDSAVIVAGPRLTGSQIIKTRLEAQLVTISSCNSAGSRNYAGEGLVGLAWAFLRAGARRVVAAQWEVNDIATPKLMKRMYAELADGREPADALRTAKLDMLRKGKYTRPVYWAPFILYGAP